jgi:hypothetical protein
MRKREQDAHEKKLRAGFVRLLFAAQNLIARLRYCHAGEPGLYCAVCAVCLAEAGDGWPAGLHADGCPVGQVAAVVAELMSTVTVEELGRGLEPAAGGAALSWAAAVRRAFGAGRQEPPEAAGGPGGGQGSPGRKPPARAGTGAEAIAIEISAAGTVDFGEPWRLAAIEGGMMVLDRAGQVKFFVTDENDPNMRRVAACVNLCAGMPTHALENAFTEIASTSPRWALLALNMSNLTHAHVAMLRDYIDDVVKAAAREDPARGFGRLQ